MQGLGWGQLCRMASPGAGHIWAAEPSLPGDNKLGLSPCHPHCIHWVSPLLLAPCRDCTLPIWGRPFCCCQGTRSGTLSGTAPRWLSQPVTVRGGGDDIHAPAKTNTAPSKHAGLGKPVPQPSITEPTALQPTTAQPGSGAVEKQQEFKGGLGNIPPPRPQRCLTEDGAPTFTPPPGCQVPTHHCHRVLGNARGSVPKSLVCRGCPGWRQLTRGAALLKGVLQLLAWPQAESWPEPPPASYNNKPRSGEHLSPGWSSKGPDIPNICGRERGRQRAIGEVPEGPHRVCPLPSVLGWRQQSVASPGQLFRRARFSLEGQILLLPHIPAPVPELGAAQSCV